MKLNNIGYLLKEGFRSIFQHGFMSFAAICVTVACLIIVGSFSALAYNLDIMVQDLNKTSEIMVYIDSDLSDAEARSIGTKINLLDNVFDAKYVSREEALQNFVSDHDNDSAFSGVQAQDLRHRAARPRKCVGFPPQQITNGQRCIPSRRPAKIRIGFRHSDRVQRKSFQRLRPLLYAPSLRQFQSKICSHCHVLSPLPRPVCTRSGHSMRQNRKISLSLRISLYVLSNLRGV